MAMEKFNIDRFVELRKKKKKELVGSFLLSQLQDLNINVGLYPDDGLAITSATPKDTENIKKEICRTLFLFFILFY